MSVARLTHLQPVPEPQTSAPVAFCSHCGRAPRPARHQSSRVCTHCELGLILRADAELAPRPDEPFVVCDEGRLICALSEAAERVLAISEPAVIHRPLSDLLVAASEEERSDRTVDALVSNSARGLDDPGHAVVCPVETFGVRFSVRIGTCGPPSAALVVLTETL